MGLSQRDDSVRIDLEDEGDRWRYICPPATPRGSRRTTTSGARRARARVAGRTSTRSSRSSSIGRRASPWSAKTSTSSLPAASTGTCTRAADTP